MPEMPIVSIDLDLTNNCVLKCDYCFRGDKNVDRISWEVASKAIDFLLEHSQNEKKLSVALFGGEPLMEFEIIKKLVPYAQDKATPLGKTIHFTATTNCVLASDEIIDFFRQNKLSFHTSIDGGPESHDKHRHFPDGRGSHAIIEPKIKTILKYWPNSTARMTVSNDTVGKWHEDTLYLVGLGYKNLAMIPVPECAWTEDQFNQMKQELRKISDFYIDRYRKGSPIYIKHIEDSVKGIADPQRRTNHCGAGRGSVLVKTNGDLYPCHRFGGCIDADRRGVWKLGSVFTGVDKATRDKLIRFNCVKDTKADCENCLAVHTCGICCIAINWQCFGDIACPHPNQCRFYNLFFAEAMRIHYLLRSERNALFMKKFHPPTTPPRVSPRNASTTASAPK